MPQNHVPLEFADGFYRSQSLPFSSQRCVNMSPRAAENNAYSKAALFSVSGVSQLIGSGTLDGVCRGMTTMGGILYSVNGTKLYKIQSDLSATELGTVTGTKRVSMANNNTKLSIVVPAGDMFVYDASADTFVQVTPPDVASFVVFKDGYYVFSASDGRTFFNSKINDPTQFEGSHFGTAEINPDLIVGLIVNHNQLYVLGEETIEVFATVGGTGFPFLRIAGQSSQKGIYAPFSAINYNDDWVWIGGGYNERASIWGMAGTSQIYNISTDAIDNEINKFTRDELRENAFALTFSEDNQLYVAFTFVSENDRIPSKTFVYNATSSRLLGKRIWHERQSGVSEGKWRVNVIQEVYDYLVVGDSEDSRMGQLDSTSTVEYTDSMIKEFSTQPFSNLNYALYGGMIELTVEAGTGLVSGQGSDPIVEMNFSDNGGRLFNNPMQRKLGKLGEYWKRVQWRRQGRTPQHRCLKFRVSDPVTFNIVSLTTLVEGGTQ